MASCYRKLVQAQFYLTLQGLQYKKRAIFTFHAAKSNRTAREYSHFFSAPMKQVRKSSFIKGNEAQKLNEGLPIAVFISHITLTDEASVFCMRQT